MCNPSPRGRCPGDAAKAVSSKIANFKKSADDFLSKTEAEHVAEVGAKGYREKQENLESLTYEVNEAKIFLYATPKGQGDPTSVKQEINKLQSELSPEAKRLLDKDETRNRKLGKVLSKFQSFARDHAKENPKNNAETARAMANGLFAWKREMLQSGLKASHAETVEKKLSATDPAKHEVAKAQLAAQYRANRVAIDEAFSIATEDAMDAVEKDRKKNSQTYENTIDRNKFGFYKNTDGSFTVRTRFNVEAKNLGEAIEKAEASFKLEEVQLTMGAPKDGVYQVDTVYSYKGGESIEDAKKFHKEAWNGTPRWRATLADAKRVQDNYDEDNKQGKYARVIK